MALHLLPACLPARLPAVHAVHAHVLCFAMHASQVELHNGGPAALCRDLFGVCHEAWDIEVTGGGCFKVTDWCGTCISCIHFIRLQAGMFWIKAAC